MYIINNNVRYPCMGYAPREGISASFTGIEGLRLPVFGIISLCNNDGFLLATQICEDYALQVYENSVLTLTNEPELIPQPEPELQKTISMVDVAEMMIDHETRISQMELGVTK